MAAITSAQAGDWSATATWTGGVVPGNGDTVTINHAVTVTDSRTVGHSPGAGDATAAILVNGTAGSLTISTGGTLVVRGDIKLNNAVLTGSGTGVLEFDASAAASPATALYVLQIGTAGSQASAKLVVLGTSNTNRFTIRSNAGGANGRITAGGFQRGGKHDVRFCNFLRIGDATNAAITNIDLANVGDPYKLHDCTFDSCGAITCSSVASSTSQLERVRCKFVNGVNSTSRDVDESGSGALGAGGTRLFRNCSFEKLFRIANLVNWTLEDNYFNGTSTAAFSSLTISGNTTWASFARNVARSGGGGPMMTIFGDVTDSFFIKDHATNNPHGITVGDTTTNRAQTVSGCVWEYTGDDDTGDMILAGNSTSPVVHTIRNCIVLPNAVGWGPGSLQTSLGGGNYGAQFLHNTFVSGKPASPTGQGIYYGETYGGRTGMFPAVKSNLAFSFIANRAAVFQQLQGRSITGATQANPCVITSTNHQLPAGTIIKITGVNGMTQLNGNTYTVANPLANTFELLGVDSTAYTAYTSGGTISTLDAVAAADCDYNATYNGFVGSYGRGYDSASPTAGLWSSGAGGANDLGDVDPQFVDCGSTKWRCFALFDTDYLGNTAAAWSSGGNYAVGDIVSNVVPSRWGGRTVNYRCVSAHLGSTANSEPGAGSSWRTYWEFASTYRLREGVPVLTYTPGTPQATTRDLIEWIKAGMAPRNTTLRNAGHDGVTVGAVEGVFAGGGPPAYLTPRTSFAAFTALFA